VTERPSSSQPPAADRAITVAELHGVTCRFGDKTAVAGLTLSVPTGALVGLIGPSGAGKTTTVRLLTGGVSPTSGTVRVLGHDPRSLGRSARRRIGYMPQHFALYPDLSVRENVDFMASMYGMLWLSRRRRVPEILRLVELWDVRSRRARALSGGMQRRLELATALVHDPELVFLDEPTAGIDPLLRATVWEELRRLRDRERTLVVTTQYVGDAEECDLVAIIADGRLVAIDSPAALRQAAVGGEIVELETARPLEAAVVASLPEARSVSAIDARRVRITVDSAGTAIPAIMEELGRHDVDVTETTEYRPSFDEVFVALIEKAGLDGGAPAATQP
jgi:ABC-2 type transport system ATP-binding protein